MSKGDFIDNDRNNTGANPAEEQPQGKQTPLYFFLSLACFAAGALLFGLAFAVKQAGTYMLFSSMICELASVTFLNAQKKHGYTVWCKALRILSYVVMGAALAVVILGVSVAAK